MFRVDSIGTTMRRVCAGLARWATLDAGSALVELAVCLPLLALTLVGTADFARIFYTSIALTNAARAGAQYGAFNPAQSGDMSAMQTTAMGAAPDITPFTVLAQRVCGCWTDAGVPAGNISCTAPATSCATGHRVITVTVTTAKTFVTISSLLGIPSSIPLTRTATLRVSE